MSETASPIIPLKLLAALLAAQAEARAVEKDGANKDQHYRYARAETMIQEGRTTLARVSVVLLQGEVDLVKGTDDSATARISYLLAHASGETFAFRREWPCVAHRGRPMDKALGGALTTCLSYTIRDLLLIPRDDQQADMDRRNDSDDREPEPARKTDPVHDRDLKPANDARPAEDDARPVVPRETEHAFRRLLPLIQSRAMKSDILASEIDRADVDADERIALDLVASAYRAQRVDEIAVVGAAAREAFKKTKADKAERLIAWVLASIRPAFDELNSEPAAATAARAS